MFSNTNFPLLGGHWEPEAFDVNSLFDVFEPQPNWDTIFPPVNSNKLNALPAVQTLAQLPVMSQQEFSASFFNAQDLSAPPSMPIDHCTIGTSSAFATTSYHNNNNVLSAIASTIGASGQPESIHQRHIEQYIQTPPQSTPQTFNSEKNTTKVPRNSSSPNLNCQTSMRRNHRDAEKNRRNSLRMGFDKLKRILPSAKGSVGKTGWSHTRLLQSGLEYIVQLKEEIETREKENQKLRDAVKDIFDSKGQ